MKTIKQIMMLYSALLVIFLILSIGVTIQFQLGGMQKVCMEEVREQRMKGYDDSVRYQVQNVITLLNEIYSREQSGELTETQAQEEAKKIVKSLRYGDDGTGYFWIDATDYTLVAHPILPQNEGQNRHDLKDKNNVMIIQEIMKVVQADPKGGFSEFYFTWVGWIHAAQVFGVRLQNHVCRSNGFLCHCIQHLVDGVCIEKRK